jgi:pimeloyl-ACP methyl ester carboxylesterase
MSVLKQLALAATLSAVSALASPALADTFVIVHGAFQNAQSWEAVSKSLRAKGHTVVAVDLPGRNAQGAEAKAISIAQYAEAVGAVVKSQSQPVTLIGHSFGGITVSLVGAAMPEKIKNLVYVAAYVPVSGDSMQSLASGDKNNGFTQKSFVVSADYSFATILDEDRVRLFINDGQPEQQKAVAESMLREPLGPIATKVDIAPDKLDAIAKAYVRTTLDKTVSPALQNMLIQRAGIKKITDIDAGHSPQISQSEKLADLIITVSR